MRRSASHFFIAKLLHERVVLHFLDVGEVLLLHVGGNEVAQSASGQGDAIILFGKNKWFEPDPETTRILQS